MVLHFVLITYTVEKNREETENILSLNFPSILCFLFTNIGYSTPFSRGKCTLFNADISNFRNMYEQEHNIKKNLST